MGREGTEGVIFTVQGLKGSSKAPRVLCGYMLHDFLVSHHVKKGLRSGRMSSMLNGRPATGVHQPPLECKWRKEGGWRRGFPMDVHAAHADVQLQARHRMYLLQLCEALPHPVEAQEELKV